MIHFQLYFLKNGPSCKAQTEKNRASLKIKKKAGEGREWEEKTPIHKKVFGFNFRQLTKTFTQHMHVSLLFGPRACSIVIYCETM